MDYDEGYSWKAAALGYEQQLDSLKRECEQESQKLHEEHPDWASIYTELSRRLQKIRAEESKGLLEYR